VNKGVQHVILACTISLQINLVHLMLNLDSCNAYMCCSRDQLEEERELNILIDYMLMSFRILYGKTVTNKWNFGNGRDRPPTGVKFSREGLRKWDAPASVYFNILAARVC